VKTVTPAIALLALIVIWREYSGALPALCVAEPLKLQEAW
jgi:hypothetical protein